VGSQLGFELTSGRFEQTSGRFWTFSQWDIWTVSLSSSEDTVTLAAERGDSLLLRGAWNNNTHRDFTCEYMSPALAPPFTYLYRPIL